MPIDLTKPIRHKQGGPSVISAEEVVVVKFDHDPGSVYTVKRKAFEENYENIPEPRKPREWFMHKRSGDWEVYGSFEGLTLRDQVRLIEWPEGAELPELP